MFFIVISSICRLLLRYFIWDCHVMSVGFTFQSYPVAPARRNIMPHINSSYLKTCVFNSSTDPHCPIFCLKQIVSDAGEEFQVMAVEVSHCLRHVRWAGYRLLFLENYSLTTQMIINHLLLLFMFLLS